MENGNTQVCVVSVVAYSGAPTCKEEDKCGPTSPVRHLMIQRQSHSQIVVRGERKVNAS